MQRSAKQLLVSIQKVYCILISKKESTINYVSLTYMTVQQAEYIYICTFSEFFSTDEDDLDTIVTELKDITDVLELGLALGIRKSALDKIMQDSTKLEKQKIEVIHYWLTRRDIVRQKPGEHP